mmetsp:Transcript_12762/g.22794  ORF Transcript_12762/g.22794 Transcript_12762/m.22794 type:complete len:230 (+) Transcript_12762:1162-1851(+)
MESGLIGLHRRHARLQGCLLVRQRRHARIGTPQLGRRLLQPAGRRHQLRLHLLGGWAALLCVLLQFQDTALRCHQLGCRALQATHNAGHLGVQLRQRRDLAHSKGRKLGTIILLHLSRLCHLRPPFAAVGAAAPRPHLVRQAREVAVRERRGGVTTPQAAAQRPARGNCVVVVGDSRVFTARGDGGAAVFVKGRPLGRLLLLQLPDTIALGRQLRLHLFHLLQKLCLGI